MLAWLEGMAEGDIEGVFVVGRSGEGPDDGSWVKIREGLDEGSAVG